MNETSRKKPGDARTIAIRGAREHNLKNIDVAIPRDQLVVFTGLSGSGKSSLAFDTIYAEGQRRYVESLSAYARQFLEMMQKPDVDQIDGLSPAISIEQKTTSKNPRSTVGTVTEIYDYMRLLWARVGVPYSPATGLPIESQTDFADGRPRAGAAGRHAHLRAGAGRARPQGRIPQGTRRVPAQGLPARQDRRRVLRDRRGQAARQEIHPRHRRGGRPPGGARATSARGWRICSSNASSSPTGWRWSSCRCDALRRHLPRLRGRDGRGRGVARRKTPPPQPSPASGEGAGGGSAKATKLAAAAASDARADLLGEIRLPGLRLHHSGDRAAAVLVQQPVRRLPGMRRARRRAAHRRRSGHPRPRRHACARAPSRPGRNRRRPITSRRSTRSAKHYRFTLDTKWKDLPKKTQDAILLRLGRGRHQVRL